MGYLDHRAKSHGCTHGFVCQRELAGATSQGEEEPPPPTVADLVDDSVPLMTEARAALSGDGLDGLGERWKEL